MSFFNFKNPLDFRRKKIGPPKERRTQDEQSENRDRILAERNKSPKKVIVLDPKPPRTPTDTEDSDSRIPKPLENKDKNVKILKREI